MKYKDIYEHYKKDVEMYDKIISMNDGNFDENDVYAKRFLEMKMISELLEGRYEDLDELNGERKTWERNTDSTIKTQERFCWEDVFTEAQMQEIESFLLEKMKECRKDESFMEYALMNLVRCVAYDYHLWDIFG